LNRVLVFRSNSRVQVITYFQSLSTVRVIPDIKPGYLRPQLPAAPPQDPEPFTSIAKDVTDKIQPGLTHWQSPSFMAFFPAHTTYPSILGEMFSAAFNAPAFNWLCSPACTELETVVMDWVAQMLDLPECFLSTGSTNGGGVIQGSASEAIVVVMIAAREAVVRAQLEKEGLTERPNETEAQRINREDRAAEIKGKLVALGSEMSHSSTQKAANMLGVRFRSVRAGQDTQFRMTAANLRKKLRECADNGLTPFYLTSTIGTTGTCAVDELSEIAKIKEEYPHVWLHIDAAYAGSALICLEYRALAEHAALKHFDSFNFNMHKWLLVNFDASCLYLRNRVPLLTAMSITPSYLQNPSSLTTHENITDYRDWQIPLGRRFRALKIWFVIRTYGVKAMQEMIRKHVALGEFFAEKVQRDGKGLLEIVAGPAFALTVIRCRVPSRSKQAVTGHVEEVLRNNGTVDVESLKQASAEMNDFNRKLDTADLEADNALTKKVAEVINARGEVFLTPAVADGVSVIRVVSANELANEEHVGKAFDIILASTEEVLKGM